MNIVLEVVVLIRLEKEIKGNYIGKEEVKLSLFTADMILYLENPKPSVKRSLVFISDFSNVSKYKIHAQKLVKFLYTNNIQTESEIKNTVRARLGGSRL